jgi:hypothetical protein
MAVDKKRPRRTLAGAHRHKDKRRNIPTQELRDFVAEAALSLFDRGGGPGAAPAGAYLTRQRAPAPAPFR